MSAWQSLIFYLVSFSLSAILVYLGNLPRFAKMNFTLSRKRKVNMFTLLGLLIPISIGGFLANVGIDYDGYIRLFEKSNELSYVDFSAYNGFWTVEPTFYFISRISMFLTGSSWMMFLTYSAINIAFFYLFLKKFVRKKIALSFFVYLTVFYLFTMTLMRQGAAIAICLYSLTYLLEKRYTKYLLVVGIASLIHFSSLFFLVTWLLFFFIKPSKRNFLSIIGLSGVGLLVVASPVLIQVVTSVPPFDKYVYLLDKTRNEAMVGWTFLLQLCIAGVISFYYYKMPQRHRYAPFLYTMLILGIIAYSLNFRINYASRLSYFFLPVSTILIAYVIGLFRNNKVLVALILLSCIAYFVKIYYVGNTLYVFPYNFIWSI